MNIGIKKKNIFYNVRVDDYNRDNKLTTEDPAYLFVSDKDGKNFRQISPVNCNLNSWHYVASTNKIIMATTKDSDKNLKFGETDEIAAFEIDFDNETQATEIFSTAFKNKLKIMFETDWKQLDE